MEMELLNEVDVSFKMKMQNIDSDIKEVEETLASLEKDRQMIQTAKSENVSEKYVQVKLGHERKKIATDRLETLERSKKIIRLWFDPYLQMTGSKTNILGQIISSSAVEVERFIGEFDARISKDDNICSIRDMCLCADGDIVMTDYNNNRIKKMNESYTVASSLTVNDNPFGICQIDASLVAVTLINKKKVQFVCKKEPMALSKSFNVSDRCRGIAYNDGMIYVCCGGSRKREEGAGHIEVYTTNGTLMKSYYGEIQCPGNITVPSWGKKMYVTDGYGDGVHIIHEVGNQRDMVQKDTKLDGAEGSCWINRSQVCIAGFDSKNIVLMSSDGRMYEELLTEKDGIINANSLCFNEKQLELVVSAFKSGNIKVYSLKISNC